MIDKNPLLRPALAKGFELKGIAAIGSLCQSVRIFRKKRKGRFVFYKFSSRKLRKNDWLSANETEDVLFQSQEVLDKSFEKYLYVVRPHTLNNKTNLVVVGRVDRWSEAGVRQFMCDCAERCVYVLGGTSAHISAQKIIRFSRNGLLTEARRTIYEWMIGLGFVSNRYAMHAAVATTKQEWWHGAQVASFASRLAVASHETDKVFEDIDLSSEIECDKRNAIYDALMGVEWLIQSEMLDRILA